MVGIPMDRVGAGVLECGCYRTANGSGCCLGCISQVVWGTLLTLALSNFPTSHQSSGRGALCPLLIFSGVVCSLPFRAIGQLYSNCLIARMFWGLVVCCVGCCVGYTSGAVINHLLERGMGERVLCGGHSFPSRVSGV